MKTMLRFLVLGIAGLFIACGGDNAVKSDATLKIGATPIPHAQVLNLIKDDLKADGITLEVIEFTDYVTPNLSVEDGSIDANFMQHKPYMDTINKDRGLNLVSVAGIHVEPMGFYSKNIKSVDELKQGDVILIPNDPSNGGRALILLHNNGIIELEDASNLNSTEHNIRNNPKGIVIKALEAAMLPKNVDDPKVKGAVINGNYALQANLPSSEALFREGAESPYVNIISVKKGNENNPNIAKLIKALTTQKVADFMSTQYKGEVVPVF